MDPIYALTGRRQKTPYADIIRAEAPTARSSYYQKKSRDLEQQALAQSRSLAESELTQNADQFTKSLEEQKRQYAESLLNSQNQFNANYNLAKENAAQQAAQAQQAQGIATIGLGLEAYPYAKDAGSSVLGLFGGGTTAAEAGSGLYGAGATTTAGYTSPVVESLFAESALGAGEAAAPAVTTGTTAGGALAGEGAGTAASTGTGGFSSVAGPIALAILGQHAAANATDRTVEGQKVGDVFSTDEQGRWSPWFSNDPWHEYFGSQWGFDRPSGGVNFEAAVKNSDWTNAAKRSGQAFNQWGDPIGDFGYDVAENYLGKDYAGFLNPIASGFDALADSKDIGDVARAGADVSAKLIDPVGGAIGTTANKAVTNWTGNETLGNVAQAFLDPVGTTANAIEDISWLCTETEKIIGLGKNDRTHLDKLQHYSKDHPLSKHYYTCCPELIKRIAGTEPDIEAFYSKFYVETIAPVVQLVKHDHMKEAQDKWKEAYFTLLYLYAEDLLPIDRAKMPEVHHG